METKTRLPQPPSPPQPTTASYRPEPELPKETLSLLMPDSPDSIAPPQRRTLSHQDNFGFHQSTERLCPNISKSGLFHPYPAAVESGRGPQFAQSRRWEASSCDGRKAIAFLKAALVIATLCSVLGLLAFCLHVNAKLEELAKSQRARDDGDSGRWPKSRGGDDDVGGGGGGGLVDDQSGYDGGKVMQALLGMMERHPLRHAARASKKKTKRQANNEINAQEENAEMVNFYRRLENLIDQRIQMMPKVHLRGAANRGTYNGSYVTWQWKPENSFLPDGVELHRVGENLFTGIKIMYRGVYMVYSQVIIHGRNQSSRRDCSHETVAINFPYDGDFDAVHPDDVDVLMSGYLTQDNQGLRYENQTNYQFPRDSSIQLGLFSLQYQSQVRVRIPTYDDECRSLFHTSSESASFGLFKIALS